MPVNREQQKMARELNERRLSAVRERPARSAEQIEDFLNESGQSFYRGLTTHKPMSSRERIEGNLESLREDPSALLDLVPGGGAGVFIGRKIAQRMAQSPNAGRQAFKRQMDFESAEEMERAGQDAYSIWNETGWWRGPDKKWRTEVSDEGVFFSPRQYERASTEITDAKKVIAHPDPNLMEAVEPLSFGRAALREGLRGKYSQARGIDEPVLWLNRFMDETNSVESTLHELQHHIQQVEDFEGKGSSRIGILHGAFGKGQTLAYFRNILNEAREFVRKYGPNALASIDAPVNKEWKKYIFEKALHNTYVNEPGELEAREVAQRWNSPRLEGSRPPRTVRDKIPRPDTSHYPKGWDYLE